MRLAISFHQYSHMHMVTTNNNNNNNTNTSIKIKSDLISSNSLIRILQIKLSCQLTEKTKKSKKE